MRTLETSTSRDAFVLAPAAPALPERVPRSHQPVQGERRSEPTQPERQTADTGSRAHPQRSHLAALAGLQVIVGYQLWASGVDKLLFGRFPATVGSLLAGTLAGGRVPAPFAALMRAVVLPHSALFGVLVEWGETLAGLGLIASAVFMVTAPIMRRRMVPELRQWVAQATRVVWWLTLGAAAGGALMGLSFYFVDGAPSQWVAPSVAFGGVLDPGFLVLLGCVAIVVDGLAGGLNARRHPAQSAL